MQTDGRGANLPHPSHQLRDFAPSEMYWLQGSQQNPAPLSHSAQWPISVGSQQLAGRLIAVMSKSPLVFLCLTRLLQSYARQTTTLKPIKNYFFFCDTNNHFMGVLFIMIIRYGLCVFAYRLTLSQLWSSTPQKTAYNAIVAYCQILKSMIQDLGHFRHCR